MKVLTEDQKRSYEENGYLLLERFVSEEWLDKLWAVTNRFVEESRQLTDSTEAILVEPEHTPENPRLRRIPHTVIHDPVFEEFGLRGPLLDIAEDLLGPNLKFHHSKLNFKWHSGGEEVKWHQDIQFWPHTNYSPLTIGVYLDDVTPDMGPMGIIPGSHKRELYNLASEDGTWTGSINDTDLKTVDLDNVAWLQGPRGSVTVHSCRSVHGSYPNRSATMRPLLLHTYAPADALTVTDLVSRVAFSDMLVRGEQASHIRFDDTPCPMPPSFKPGEYSSIFKVQQNQM